jgi:tetratricopeptide (TPR) repeat protein
MNKFSKVCLLVFVLFAALSNESFAQRKKNRAAEAAATTPAPVQAEVTTPAVSAQDTEMQRLQKVFNLALKYSDGAVAKQAMFEMMALNPENTALKDSLALLYYNLGSYAECVLVTRDILAEKPNDLTMLELRAVSQKQLGMLREAMADFEKIYLNTNDVLYMYEVASLQYEMKLYNECKVSLDILLNSSDIDKETIALAASQFTQQNVPMRAAVLNLKGVVAAEQNDSNSARTIYKEALKLYPDFVLAKANLESLDKPAAPVKKAAPAKK